MRAGVSGLVVTGTQSVATLGDSSRFAATLLRILGPLQLALAVGPHPPIKKNGLQLTD